MEELTNNNQVEDVQEELQQHIFAEVMSDDDSDDDAVIINYQYHVKAKEQRHSNDSVKNDQGQREQRGQRHLIGHRVHMFRIPQQKISNRHTP